MMPEWVIWLVGALAPGVAAVWLFFTKVWFPEQAKVREHERQMAAEAEAVQRREESIEQQHEREQVESRNAAEQAEQIAVWSQMTQLQSQALRQNELLLEYIVNDFTTGQEKIIDEVRKMIYDLREMQAKMTILISLISEDHERRRKDAEK